MIAYTWASGLIEFGGETPEGALPIAIAKDAQQGERLREIVRVLARHGKGESKGQLLVPGIPEASDQQQAMKALQRFNALVQADLAGEPRNWSH